MYYEKNKKKQSFEYKNKPVKEKHYDCVVVWWMGTSVQNPNIPMQHRRMVKTPRFDPRSSDKVCTIFQNFMYMCFNLKLTKLQSYIIAPSHRKIEAQYN